MTEPTVCPSALACDATCPTHDNEQPAGRVWIVMDDKPDALGYYPHQYAAGVFRRRGVVELAQPKAWDPLGYKPRPVTRWQRFRSHLGHGLLMQYPLLDVIAFSVRGLVWKMEPE